MKKITAIIILFLCFSCDSIFHDELNPYLKVDSYEEQVTLLNGIYSHLAAIYDNNYFVSMRRSDDLNIYNKFRAECKNDDDVDDEGTMQVIYQHAYISIVNVNRLLAQLTVDNDKEIMGELYFLRGYLYYVLARFYGTPPLIDDYEVNYLVEKPSFAEVYQFIEDDLLLSIELLPETFSEARIPHETPNVGMAKALLAEVYLSMGGYPVNDESKYELAAQYAGEVIENAGKYGYGLEANLDTLWSNSLNYSKECIFGMHVGTDPYSRYSNLGAFYNVTFAQNKFFEINSRYHPGFYFIDHFPDGYRKIRSLTKGYYYDGTIETYENDEDPVDLSNNYYLGYRLYDPKVDPCRLIKNAVFTKWFDTATLKITYTSVLSTSLFVDQFFTNIYLLRFAQTLLTYAEAKARAGQLDESAYDAVNKVRRRANQVNMNNSSAYDLQTTSTEQFIDSVVWERAWELCFEPNGRWFDIVRLDLKDEVENMKYAVDPADEIDEELLTKDWYFFKVPQEDRWANPNFNTDNE